MLRSPTPAIFLVCAAAACEPETEVRVEYEPYAGEAYPDRVEPVAYPATGAALVTDSYSDTISVIDLVTGARIDQRPTGRNPVDIDGPHHAVIDPAAGFVLVALSYPKIGASGPHATHGSSVTSGYVQKLSLAGLTPFGQVRVDPNPGDIVISDDRTRVVVSHFDLERATKNPMDIEAARATLAILDPASIAPEGSLPPQLIKTCVAPHGVALTPPSGSIAYVACYGEDRLAVVHLDEPGTPVELFDVGPGVVGFGAPSYGPYVAQLTPDGAWVVVASTVSKDVRFFDTTAKAFDPARTETLLGAPYFSAFLDDGRIVVPTQQPDALVVLDPSGVEPAEIRSFSAAECVLPHEVVAVEDALFVVCEGDKKSPGKIVKLDATLAVVASAEVGIYPDAFRPIPGGGP
jgi:YVTN family beta-propeller protein